jgi:hypothetical protein
MTVSDIIKLWANIVIKKVELTLEKLWNSVILNKYYNCTKYLTFIVG